MIKLEVGAIELNISWGPGGEQGLCIERGYGEAFSWARDEHERHIVAHLFGLRFAYYGRQYYKALIEQRASELAT